MTELLPLAGQCFVSTRPAGQEHGLRHALAALGGELLNFPVIEIEPADPAPLQALDLARLDLAFFVSPNAVEQAFNIRPFQEWPPALRVATVGPGSAQALVQQGYASVIRPDGGFDSEAVLALPEFSAQRLAGKRVLIVRGEGGRELLADTLRARGAQLSEVSSYRRRCATLNPEPLRRRFQCGELFALIFTASEALRFFLHILGEDGLPMLQALPCFAPHPRICDALRAAGAAQVQLTEPGDSGLAQGVLKYALASGSSASKPL